MSNQTLWGLLESHCATHPNKEWLFSRQGESVYQGRRYVDIKTDSELFALGLKSLGVLPTDNVGIFSENRPEWVVADLGILSMGAVVVPLYATSSMSDIKYIISDSSIKVMIVDTVERAELLRDVRVDTCLNDIIVMESDQTDMIGWESVLNTGQQSKKSVRIEYQKAQQRVNRDMLASIVYTSGTTGHPKGVMLTHHNILSNVEDILQILALGDSDRVLSFLPLAHTFERTAGYYVPLAAGVQIYYAENINSVAKDMLIARPTVLVSVPRLYEKIHAKVLDNAKGLRKKILFWALSLKPTDRVRRWIANWLVFSKIRKKTGGCIRFFVSGGAALSPSIAQFFETMGFPMIAGYGLTETAPIVSCNRLEKRKVGTVGLPLPSVETKIADDQELLVKGPNVMQGYFKLPDETQAVIDQDGWLHTGDVVTMDAEGFLTIIDRKKEMIVLSNGKNISPVKVEEVIARHPEIEQVMVIGDKKNFLTALIVPSHAENQYTHQWWKKEIDQYQSVLANFEKVKKFVIIKRPFTQENGDLTPTLKLKRKVIRERYKAIIQSMYDE